MTFSPPRHPARRPPPLNASRHLIKWNGARSPHIRRGHKLTFQVLIGRTSPDTFTKGIKNILRSQPRKHSRIRRNHRRTRRRRPARVSAPERILHFCGGLSPEWLCITRATVWPTVWATTSGTVSTGPSR
nr:hypothetical protein [Crucivirus sp.]